MAAQAIDIVYQLNASEDSDSAIFQRGESPLESLSFGTNGKADVTLKGLADDGPPPRLSLPRFDPAEELQLAASLCSRTAASRGGFCRIYPGQRILIGDQVLTYQELTTYFNAKKNVSLTQIFVRVNKDSDEVGLERSRSRESSSGSHIRFEGSVKALRDRRCSAERPEIEVRDADRGALEDRIVFHNDSEMDLIDLRRRARAHGWAFPAESIEVRVSRIE